VTSVTRAGDENDQTQIGLRALSQELDDGKNIRASISRSFAPSYATDPAKPELGPPVEPALLVSEGGQLGPWDTGYIVFDGIAVGGYSNLTLYQNGAYNFSGHFHVSGAISYDDSLAWAVKDSNIPPSIYVFAHQGRVHGTFEHGSRDDDWGKSEVLPAMAAGWAALQHGWSWNWQANLNADFGVFLDDIIRVVAAGMAIGNVIKIFA
jgi:hypothetical protein